MKVSVVNILLLGVRLTIPWLFFSRTSSVASVVTAADAVEHHPNLDRRKGGGRILTKEDCHCLAIERFEEYGREKGVEDKSRRRRRNKQNTKNGNDDDDDDGDDDDDDDVEWDCQFPDGSIARMNNVPFNIRKKLHSGETSVCALGAYHHDEELEFYGDDTKVTLEHVHPAYLNNRRRRRSLSTGGGSGGGVTTTKKVLFVRIKDKHGRETTPSSSTIANFAFDSKHGSSMASQYRDCSKGKFIIEPLGIAGKTDEPGVITASINDDDFRIADNDDGKIRERALKTIQEMTGLDPPFGADHILLCIPPSKKGFIAYAYMNHWLSVYSDSWCTSLSATVHEIGHNNNLGHSGILENKVYNKYGDKSGMMSYSSSSTDGPKKCFNSAKMWQLEWFRDKDIVANSFVNKPFITKLVGFVDYGTNKISSSDYNINVKLPDRGRNGNKVNDHFVSFNRAIRENVGTERGEDQVIITMNEGNNKKGATSYVVAILNAGDSYTIVKSDGEELVVSVTSIHESSSSPWYADIIITSNRTPEPTFSPTPRPTIKQPTKAPTKRPTPRPSQRTFKLPTKTPTPRPTKRPFNFPNPTKTPTTPRPTPQLLLVNVVEEIVFSDCYGTMDSSQTTMLCDTMVELLNNNADQVDCVVTSQDFIPPSNTQSRRRRRSLRSSSSRHNNSNNDSDNNSKSSHNNNRQLVNGGGVVAGELHVKALIEFVRPNKNKAMLAKVVSDTVKESKNNIVQVTNIQKVDKCLKHKRNDCRAKKIGKAEGCKWSSRTKYCYSSSSNSSGTNSRSSSNKKNKKKKGGNKSKKKGAKV